MERISPTIRDMETRHPILITGVNGFIASHLAERLAREGRSVRGLARRPESAAWLAAQGVEIAGGDLLDDILAEIAVHTRGWVADCSVHQRQAFLGWIRRLTSDPSLMQTEAIDERTHRKAS